MFAVRYAACGATEGSVILAERSYSESNCKPRFLMGSAFTGGQTYEVNSKDVEKKGKRDRLGQGTCQLLASQDHTRKALT